MRQGFKRTIPTIVALMLSIGVYAGELGQDNPPVEQSRVSSGIEKKAPIFTEDVLNGFMNELQVRMTASDVKQGLSSYLMTEAELGIYLSKFAASPAADKTRSYAEGKQVMRAMLTNAEETIRYVGQLDKVQYTNKKTLYSDDHEVFKTLLLYLDGVKDEAPVSMELIFVEIEGNFRLIQCRSDLNITPIAK